MLSGFLVVIGLPIFFLLIRKIITWYWKINKIEKLLERIEKNTRKEGVVYPDDKNYFPKK